MTIIVFYSETGTNARIARTMSDALGLQAREIRSARGHSFFGKVFGSRMGRRFPILSMDTDLSRFESVILCAPVWAGGPACQLMTFVDEAELHGKEVAVVLGCGGLRPERALGIIRGTLEAKGARMVAGETLNVGKLRGEALTVAARDLAGAIAAKLS
ncbi:MAG TPA: hypothetical protein VFH83_12495 [Spirochaetia bacterium]|nr:hypothetical protein [Spirochaetia bacterium]